MIDSQRKTLAVSVIEPVGGHGGMDYYDFGLCQGLAKAGVDVTLYTSDKTRIPTKSGFRTVISFKGVFGDDKKWIRGLRYAKAMVITLLRARLGRDPICHFHFFQAGPIEFCQMLLAKGFGFSVVVTVHDVESLTGLKQSAVLSRRTYQLADLIVVHNRWSKEELAQQFGRGLAGKIKIISHGHYIDRTQSRIEKNAAREELDIPLDKKVLLFFGQIKKEKGLDLLLEALAHVKASHPNVLLVIAGKVWKDDYAEYEKIIARHRLSPYCSERIAYVPNHEVPYYFSAADLVVLPYRRIYQSGVLLMAMSYGRAILASDLPAMTEIVREGVTGFTFRRGDVKALGDKIAALISEPDLLDQVAKNAYDAVRIQHDWNVIGAQTVSGYKSLF